MSLLGLQGYFLYSDFQTKKEDFKSDVNSILDLTSSEMNVERRKRIGQLYKRDLTDTSLVLLQFDFTDSLTLELNVIDANTGGSKMSIRVQRDKVPSDSLSKEYLLNSLIQSTFYDGFTVFSGAFGERISSYVDTLSIDMKLFRNELNRRLLDKAVSPNYEMVFLHRDSTFVVPSHADVISNRYKVNHRGEKQEVLIYFNDPFLDILKRSRSVLIICLGVFVIIIISFNFFVETIRKQRKLSELKDDFIDGMTHELLTPISTLKLALESLEKSEVLVESGKSKNYLEVSKMELNRINDIVQNVLYSSLHQQKELKLNIEKVNLNELIEALINYHKTRSHADLEISFNGLENPYVTSDAQHLTNVFHNLLDNAIKYSGSETIRIDIVAKRFENEISIEVNDNGKGIADEYQTKIFDKFYRVPFENDGVNGLGIGLHYVRTILASLNGKIELLHSSDKGSSFRVSLNTTNKHE